MKAEKFLKITAIAVMTTGFAVGCASSGSESTEAVVEEVVVIEEPCEGATPEVRNAIYAAKLKNARARNLGYEWRDTAKLIEAAEAAGDDCDNDRALVLANKAEQEAADAIAQYNAEQARIAQEEADAMEAAEAASASANAAAESMYIGGYLVISGDNLWNIAEQDSVYGNPYQWPLIYKANSGQIKDADLIFPGQYFNIPKAMEPESSIAIEHAKNRGAWTIGETEASDMDYLNR